MRDVKKSKQDNVVKINFTRKLREQNPLINSKPIGFNMLDVMVNLQKYRDDNPQMKSFAEYLERESDGINRPWLKFQSAISHNALRLEYFKDAILSNDEFIDVEDINLKDLLDTLHSALIFSVENAMDFVEDVDDGIIDEDMDEEAVVLFAEREIPDEIENRLIEYFAKKFFVGDEITKAQELYEIINSAFTVHYDTSFLAVSLGMNLEELRNKICS